jgi:hypothetical protein
MGKNNLKIAMTDCLAGAKKAAGTALLCLAIAAAGMFAGCISSNPNAIKAADKAKGNVVGTVVSTWEPKVDLKGVPVEHAYRVFSIDVDGDGHSDTQTIYGFDRIEYYTIQDGMKVELNVKASDFSWQKDARPVKAEFTHPEIKTLKNAFNMQNYYPNADVLSVWIDPADKNSVPVSEMKFDQDMQDQLKRASRNRGQLYRVEGIVTAIVPPTEIGQTNESRRDIRLGYFVETTESHNTYYFELSRYFPHQKGMFEALQKDSKVEFFYEKRQESIEASNILSYNGRSYAERTAMRELILRCQLKSTETQQFLAQQSVPQRRQGGR